MSIHDRGMPKGFSPLTVYEQAIHNWWWVALWIIVGSLTGWGLSTLRQPLYEARAIFTFNIDYALSGALTDIEEDQALETVGDLIQSSEIKEKTIADAAASGISITGEDLKNSVFIERRNSAWVVIVRRVKSDEAARIANLWGENFESAYQEAYRHAIIADGLQRYMNSLESCFRETVASEPVQSDCEINDLPAIQTALEKTGAEIQKERSLGKALFAGLLFDWSGKAESSSTPVWFDRNKFLLAGAIIGFLFSLWLPVGAFPLYLKAKPKGD